MGREASKARPLLDVLYAVMILVIIILGLVVMTLSLGIAFLELSGSMTLMLADCRA